MHGALLMLFTYYDHTAIGLGLGCFLLPLFTPHTPSYSILCCIAVEKLLVFTFPRIKFNVIKLNVMMHACKSLCC